MDAIYTLLKSHPITNELTEQQIRKIAEFTSYEEVGRGEYVFRQGESAEEFYVLLNGSVEVELFSGPAGPVVLQKLGAGAILGWSWLIHPYRWCFDARVLETLKVLKIDAIRLRSLMDQDPNLGYPLMKRFLQILAERLESERFRLLELYASHS